MRKKGVLMDATAHLSPLARREFTTLKRSITRRIETIPVIQRAYWWARRNYHGLRRQRAARRYFIDYGAYREALAMRSDGTVQITAADGLEFTVRRNIDDAYILAEMFLDRPYVRYLNLRSDPVIVDIGGYIADFSLYAVKYLNARKVIVYEPSPKNFAILNRNVVNNDFEDRIEAVNMAVGDVPELILDTDQEDAEPAMVSLSLRSSGQRIPCVTLEELMRRHQLDTIDLLKLDCEGAEYPILLSLPLDLLTRIQNIALEYHEVEGFTKKLDAVRQRLIGAGYRLKIEPPYVYAVRQR
jgi:FkbM family methyltransferase